MRENRSTLKSQDDNEAVVKNINVEINAQVNNVSKEPGKTTRAHLKQLATLGECDVLLRHEQFMYVSPVIVAVDLAPDCLFGMNVLVP